MTRVELPSFQFNLWTENAYRHNGLSGEERYALYGLDYDRKLLYRD